MSSGLVHPVGSKAWLKENFGLCPDFDWRNRRRIRASFIQRVGACQYIFVSDTRYVKALTLTIDTPKLVEGV